MRLKIRQKPKDSFATARQPRGNRTAIARRNLYDPVITVKNRYRASNAGTKKRYTGYEQTKSGTAAETAV